MESVRSRHWSISFGNTAPVRLTPRCSGPSKWKKRFHHSGEGSNSHGHQKSNNPASDVSYAGLMRASPLRGWSKLGVIPRERGGVKLCCVMRGVSGLACGGGSYSKRPLTSASRCLLVLACGWRCSDDLPPRIKAGR